MLIIFLNIHLNSYIENHLYQKLLNRYQLNIFVPCHEILNSLFMLKWLNRTPLILILL